jgi:drug/metabolite transporter (DMT)-like permease
MASVVARRDAAALVLAAACWALGTILSKVALESVAPLALLPIQLASSLAVLCAVMRWRRLPLRGRQPALLGRLGLLNPGVAYALSLVGLTSITASLSVLLWALEPVMILLLAGIVLRETITPRLVTFSAMAVAGTVLLVYDPAGAGEIAGVALTVAGIACCVVYSVATRRWIPDAEETGQVVLAQQAHALLLAVAMAAIAAGVSGIDVDGMTAIGLLAAVASGVVYYAAAYWFYLGALRRVQASTAAASFYLIPLFGVAAGALLLGERLDPLQWVGAAVLVGSVVMIIGVPEMRSRRGSRLRPDEPRG